MNKYDELIERAKRFTDTAIVGELINAVSELKKRPDVVYCRECIGKAHWYENDYGFSICGLSGLYVVEDNDFCSYGEKEDA